MRPGILGTQKHKLLFTTMSVLTLLFSATTGLLLLSPSVRSTISKLSPSTLLPGIFSTPRPFVSHTSSPHQTSTTSASGTSVTPAPTVAAKSIALTVTPVPSPTATPLSGVNALVSVDTTQAGSSIPSRFLGFSFETSQLCTVLNLDSASSAYSQLFKNLDPGTIRIGGNQGDFAAWVPNGSFSCADGNTTMTKTLVNNTISFVNKVGWNMTWAVNLAANDPSTYADEAQYVYTTAGSTLYALAIGNEPDLYATNGIRTSGYVYSNYQPEWEAYKTAITGLIPAIPIMGNDNCCSTSWFSSFLGDEHASLMLSGMHYYATSSSGSGATAPTADNLLSASLMASTVSSLTTRMNAAATYGLPYAYTETNSTSGGGKLGLSDAFASTLWGSDYIFTALEHGVKKMNFHFGSSGASYAPISSTGVVKPLYYAFLLYKKAAVNGNFMTPSLRTSNINITAHVIKGNDGTLRVIVLNKDQTTSGVVQIHTTSSYSSASALRLQAPSVSSTTGVTFGGTSVQADGTWTPQTPESVQLNGGTDAYLTVPSASGALVTLSP